MTGRSVSLIAAAAVAVMSVGAVVVFLREPARPKVSSEDALRTSREKLTHYMMVDALTPVRLANCELERFGEPHDGGYLMCGNLLESVGAGYSYGISNYDQWGCDISTKLSVTVHQYDCFDTRQPSCPTGDTVFHPECISHEPFVDDGGRVFDTLVGQEKKNGDSAKRVVVKMDVEGAEWDSLLFAPDEALERIDQLAIEFHGFREAKFLATVERLRKFFYVVNVHFNNFTCEPGLEPFPAWAYEVLFVNKKIGVLDPKGSPLRPHPLDQPNAADRVDCQEWIR